LSNRKMEVDAVVEPESLVSEDNIAMEIAIREKFVEDLANLAIVSPTRIQDLYQKYVKRPRKYKDFGLPKNAATHLAMAAKHFVAHVLQIGLQHHLSQKPGELVIEYDDMAEAIASDPRMKKLQGMLPRRITFEEAIKLRKEKFNAKEASKKKEREELLDFEQFVPRILKSKSFMEIEGLKEKMRQRAPGGSVDEPESMEIEQAASTQDKKQADTKIEKNKESSNEEQIAHENADIACKKDEASQGDVPGTSNDSMRAPFKNLSNNSPKAKNAQKKITSFYTKKEAPKKRKKEK